MLKIIEWSNSNPGPLAILLTTVVIIIGWLTGFLKFIFNKIFKKEMPYIQAGGNIHAGGNIIVGNKKIKQTVKNNLGNIQQAGGDIINHPPQSQKPIIDIDRNMVVCGRAKGNWVDFELVNIGNATAIDIKYYFTYNDKTEPIQMITATNKLMSGEKTKKITFHYEDADIFKMKVNDLKINFKYRDTSGNIYSSGRHIEQSKRADGNFNINGSLGEFFN